MSGARSQPALAAAYVPCVLAEVPRLLSQLDRESASPSAGSFDRDWWAWKFRDYPVTMLQAALLPLAQLWAEPYADNPYHLNGSLGAWIERSVVHTVSRQRSNGSFDSIGPFTQDHGVTLLMTHVLCRTFWLAGESWPEGLKTRVREAVRRASHFAGRSAEDYSFVSNHHALFALAWLEAEALTGDRRSRAPAEAEISAVLARQSPDGFYHEYGGADPGYESLGIYYLAHALERTADAALAASLKRSVEFFSHAVHPDGSVGGAYGSRCTALYMPGGFEILAPGDPAAAAIAAFFRQRLRANNVVTPKTADAMNLPILMISYLDACHAGHDGSGAAPLLPCQSQAGLRRFESAGMVTASTDRYYAVHSSARGGVLRVFDRQHERAVYQDAGYLATTENNQQWTSQGDGRALPAGGQESAGESQFAAYRPVVVTPGAFVLLRILQLTLFRSLTLGAWLRRHIVERLITRRTPRPLRLVRRVQFLPDRVEVHDQITREGSGRLRDVQLVASLTPVHMGSARYFHPSELTTPAPPEDATLAEQINASGSTERRFTITVQQ